MKHKPIRTCVSCRKKEEAEKMVRFVRCKDGEIVFDALRTAAGRGAHICKERRCFDLAFERRAFGRAFKREILAERKILENAVF